MPVWSKVFGFSVKPLSIHKETVKKWGKLWSGCKGQCGFSFASREHKGCSAFVAPSLHSHQEPSENKGLYFYLRPPFGSNATDFGIKNRLTSNPMHTAHTESHLCSTSALCQYRSTFLKVASHKAKWDFHPLCCFQNWTKKTDSFIGAVRPAHTTCLWKDEGREGGLTWILATEIVGAESSADWWPICSIWTVAMTRICFRERKKGSRMSVERPVNATWQEWAQSESCLFPAQREILSAALAPKQDLAESLTNF